MAVALGLEYDALNDPSSIALSFLPRRTTVFVLYHAVPMALYQSHFPRARVRSLFREAFSYQATGLQYRCNSPDEYRLDQD